MKVYYFQVIENLIGISFAILFLFSYFSDNHNLMISCGVGAFVFMTSQLVGQNRNQLSFLMMIVLGAIIGYFVSKWYLGAFWVCSIFSLGQIFGLLRIISSKDSLVQMLKENNMDKISLKDSIWFISMLVIPIATFLLLSNS